MPHNPVYAPPPPAPPDAAARGPEWFDSANHPTAAFEVTGLTGLGGDRYRADARLTLRGTTRKVALPVTVRIADDGGRRTARMAGDLTISRGDFAIGTGRWAGDGVVGDAVTVLVEIVAHARRLRNRRCAPAPQALPLKGISRPASNAPASRFGARPTAE